ncbi:GspH/FimT family pseudopilin [Stenotrophomonas sp. MMGLT7]|uniref:GspH/FimT family pseudopilin n=1 Tax=Stenotrophomonas sp. MMGLT7 TaxID=2901227 RepID=UPI002F918550
MPAHRQTGFTLIELLAVLAIVGLATTAVLLTLPHGDAALYRQADDFGLRLLRAKEEAILGGRTVQVGVDAAGYRFDRLDAGRWVVLEEGPFAARAWADGVQAQLPPRRERLGFRFDPTGAAEPQTLLLASGKARAEISVDPAGKVVVR